MALDLSRSGAVAVVTPQYRRHERGDRKLRLPRRPDACHRTLSRPFKAHREAHIESGMENGLQDALNLLEQVAMSLGR
jgi:hypothetical protein